MAHHWPRPRQSHRPVPFGPAGMGAHRWRDRRSQHQFQFRDAARRRYRTVAEHALRRDQPDLCAGNRPRSGGSRLERASTYGATAAMAYRIAPKLTIGGEVEYYRAHSSFGMGNFDGAAVYAGPTLHIQFNPKIFHGRGMVDAVRRPRRRRPRPARPDQFRTAARQSQTRFRILTSQDKGQKMKAKFLFLALFLPLAAPAAAQQATVHLTIKDHQVPAVPAARASQSASDHRRQKPRFHRRRIRKQDPAR